MPHSVVAASDLCSFLWYVMYIDLLPLCRVLNWKVFLLWYLLFYYKMFWWHFIIFSSLCCCLNCV